MHAAVTAMRPAAIGKARLWRGLKSMSPAYFGMAMATGIVSIAAHLLGYAWLAMWLFRLNLTIFIVLWLLLVMRVWLYPRNVLDDFIDHLRGPGFFTTVAACGILGSQCILIVGSLRWAAALWVAALLLWIALRRATTPTARYRLTLGTLAAILGTTLLTWNDSG